MFLAAAFDAPQVQTRKALLCVDLQNDFLAEDGTLPVVESEGIISRVAQLVAAFRTTGDVIWVNTEYQDDRETVSTATGSYVVILPRFLPESSDDATDDHENDEVAGPSGDSEGPELRDGDEEAFLAELPDDGQHPRCCLPNTLGSQMPDRLKSLVDRNLDSYIIKSDYSAFATGPLLLTLRTKLVTELFLVGSLSNISAYATAVDAIRAGFSITLVEDCLGYRNLLCHEEAVRQMTDMLGAESVTSSELQVAAYGELETPATNEPQISGLADRSAQEETLDSLPLRPKIEDWIRGVSSEHGPQDSSAPGEGSSQTGRAAKSLELKATEPDEGPISAEASKRGTVQSASPPRKRSPDDMEGGDINEATIDNERLVPTSTGIAGRASGEQVDEHPPRRRRTVKEGKGGQATSSSRGLGRSSSSGTKVPLHTEVGKISISDNTLSKDQLRQEASSGILGQVKPGIGELARFGEGDSYLLQDLLPETSVNGLFQRLKDEVDWQKMYHRSGAVPRLVAVQGQVQPDGSIPIYRHPADESPPLLPYSPGVDMIRDAIEKAIGQPLNHVLIQLYRSGEDNISEHSDKTLDIVRGSNIVNYSIGAQRTMTLRTKKSSADNLFKSMRIGRDVNTDPETLDEHEIASIAAPRKIQRVDLPHNSLFVLGIKTNAYWLHSIRADKRRPAEKTVEELDFGGQRVSLTFRQIGTFVNPRTHLIWGQGATSKEASTARKIKDNDQDEVDRMIMAFGQENHQSREFDWEKTYGTGFDVVNFTTADPKPASGPEPSAQQSGKAKEKRPLGQSE